MHCKFPVLSTIPIPTAFHPDSTRTLNLLANADTDIGIWEAAPETTDLQEIPGLEGLELSSLLLRGVFGAGDYLGILEVIAVDTMV